MKKSLRIVFAGTPEFGLPCLENINTSHHELIAVFTQPDRPSGRGRKLQASAVKSWAIEKSIPVYQPINFKDMSSMDELTKLKPDVLVVIAYGLILPPSVLAIPKYGCVNVHASILPKWRGASPIHHAILYGDSKTGVTIMQMDKGMDTGDFYEIATCDINENDTTSTLHDRLATIATPPLLNTLSQIAENKAVPIKQDNKHATYAPKIKKDDANINWQQTAKEINQKIRAFNPWPLAYTKTNQLTFQILEAQVVINENLKPAGTILEVSKSGLLISTSKDYLLIKKIRFPGKKTISIADYLNGNRCQLEVGMSLQ
jgi:methionyl-tRNA formyltransferase